MNKTFLFIALVSLLFACKDPGVNQQQDAVSEKSPEEIADSTVRAIKRNFEASSPAASFDSFRKAMLIGDGTTVSEMAGQGTLDYYARIYQKVMTAPKSEVESLPMGEHQMVLLSRLLLPERGLSSMDTKSFLKSLVETGAIDKVSLGLIKTGDIQSQEGTASAPALIFDSPANMSITFEQDGNGEWKISMGDVIGQAAVFYDERFKSMGKDAMTQIKNSVAAFASNGQFDASLYNTPK